MRKLLIPLLAAVGLLAGAATAGAAPTSGVNDYSCTPSAQHLEPVVLVHGLGANGPLNFATLAPTLAGHGYCVFYLTYGTGILGPTVGGLRPMEDSASSAFARIASALALRKSRNVRNTAEGSPSGHIAMRSRYRLSGTSRKNCTPFDRRLLVEAGTMATPSSA